MEKSDLVMFILLQLGLIFISATFPTFHHALIDHLLYALDGANAVIGYELIYLKNKKEK